MKKTNKLLISLFVVFSVSSMATHAETFTVSARVIGSDEYKHSSNNIFDVMLGERNFRIINNQDTDQSFTINYEADGNEEIRFSPGFGNNAFIIPANSYQVVRYRLSQRESKPRGEFVITNEFSKESLRIDPK